jgi:hypothetical protein
VMCRIWPVICHALGLNEARYVDQQSSEYTSWSIYVK